ncbi:hypothetical protein SCUCBS95973_002268 [Sporothrix curviconia]|uniref:C6 zinc finger domain containing protein n=1 Tax=Sporothrix curviconia TaxID=1260050 RepID=A0ABP0B6B2_9PEZI
MPLPSAILDVEYPNHPGIVDALCQIRLGDDAPRRGLPSEEARLFTEGWDAENISIYLQPRQPHQQRSKSLGDKAANLPPKTGYDKDIKCCTRESHAPSSSSEHFGTSTTLSANPDLAKEAAFAPASLFISIPTPDSTPDVLIMTPLEGPSEGADPFDDGPSCSWAPYFFRGRPESGPIVQHGTSGKTPDLLVPYIRQLGVTDSPLALPMGTRIINFLPDFEINSPVRCFLHTSCHGPPPPATPLPILQSLPSFGSATTAAQVTTLPVEPPPVEALEEMVGLTATEEDAIRSPTIAEYATFAGAYKEWTHTCIALHQVAGHITGSQVESAATGLADMIRLLITSAQPMGLLSESAYQGTHAAPFVAPVALYHKQVFWARFVALAFAVLSEHALRVDLVAGGSEWAASVPEPAVMEALIIPDRSQTPTPTPLAGRVFRVDGYLSLDSMVPEHWWRYGRNADTAWDDFLNKFQERYSMPSIYNDKETESPHSPIPKEARLSDASDGADYEGYSIYRDFGNGDDMHSLYGAVYDLAEGQMTGSILTAGSVNGAAVDGDEMRAKNSGNLDDGTKANGDASEDEDEDEYLEQQDQIQDSKGCTVVKGITKAQLVANPASLNLMSQLTAVRVRGGLRALANVIYGEGKGPGCLAAREDADTVLARAQFDMIQAMADDTVHAFERLLHWEPCEGPRSHTGIRTIRQKLSKTYRHPLELYSAVV